MRVRSRGAQTVRAVCGIAAPAAFIGGWVAAGAATPGYSPLRQAISQLAREGAPTRVLMTGAFVAFGMLTPLYARALGDGLASTALRVSVTTAGLTTLGVAAFPLSRVEGGAQDVLHAVWAGAGYVAMAVSPLLAAGPLARLGYGRAAAASRVVGALSAGSLAATLAGGATGGFQRLGLTVVDLWFATVAAALLRAPECRLGPAAAAPPVS